MLWLRNKKINFLLCTLIYRHVISFANHLEVSNQTWCNVRGLIWVHIVWLLNKQGKLVKFLSPSGGLFGEKSKSQNRNPISPTTKSISGTIQVTTKACQLCSTAKVIINIIKCTILIFVRQTKRQFRVCVRTKFLLALCSMLYSFRYATRPTSHKKLFWLFDPIPEVGCACKGNIFACMLLFLYSH